MVAGFTGLILGYIVYIMQHTLGTAVEIRFAVFKNKTGDPFGVFVSEHPTNRAPILLARFREFRRKGGCRR